ncbi:MAG: hypothetical protein AAF416_17640 [Pseudomonadota bacterium]
MAEKSGWARGASAHHRIALCVCWAAILLPIRSDADGFVLSDAQLDTVTAGADTAFVDSDAFALAIGHPGTASTFVDSATTPGESTAIAIGEATGPEGATVDGFATTTNTDGSGTVDGNAVATATSEIPVSTFIAATSAIADADGMTTLDVQAVAGGEQSFAGTDASLSHGGATSAVLAAAGSDSFSEHNAPTVSGSSVTNGASEGIATHAAASGSGDAFSLSSTQAASALLTDNGTVELAGAAQAAGAGEGSASQATTTQLATSAGGLTHGIVMSTAASSGEEVGDPFAATTSNVTGAADGSEVMQMTTTSSGSLTLPGGPSMAHATSITTVIVLSPGLSTGAISLTDRFLAGMAALQSP